MRIFIIFALILNVLSCKNESIKVRNLIKGDWELIQESSQNYSGFNVPFGISFSDDSVEIFNGLFQLYNDSSTNRKVVKYKGNFTGYITKGDSIIIKNSFKGSQDLRWKFIKVNVDTLWIAVNDSMTRKLQRLKSAINKPDEFDQIIISNWGCYGSCPAFELSVNKQGEVLYNGRVYVEKTGSFEGHFDRKEVDFVFSKFNKANPITLRDEYMVEHTDDKTIVTTFVKDRKIVKTIHDYGGKGTSNLFWAYIPISNLYINIALQKVEFKLPFNPNIQLFAFVKDSAYLMIESSESYFLWTELKKGHAVETSFEIKYTIWFNSNYYDSEFISKGAIETRSNITSIKSDGRYFRFEFKKANPITIDLGYDFVKRNFKDRKLRTKNGQ